jgi:hypothetical protein
MNELSKDAKSNSRSTSNIFNLEGLVKDEGTKELSHESPDKDMVEKTLRQQINAIREEQGHTADANV